MSIAILPTAVGSAWLLSLGMAIVSLEVALAQEPTTGSSAQCCQPAQATPSRSFALALDSASLGLGTNSPAEFLVYDQASGKFPSWLQQTSGAGTHTAGMAGLTSDVILYGTPHSDDANAIVQLQIEAVDQLTLQTGTAVQSISVGASPQNNSFLYRLLFPLQELSAAFVRSKNIELMLHELRREHDFTELYAYELTRPPSYGTVVRQSLRAPEGLYMTVVSSRDIQELLQTKRCSSSAIRTLVQMDNQTAYCYQETVNIAAQPEPVAEFLTVGRQEPYQPIAFDDRRRDHTNDFVVMVTVSTVLTLAFIIIYTTIFASKMSWNLFGNVEAMPDARPQPAKDSDHRNIHRATIRLRHLTSGQPEFSNPMYDDKANVLDAHVHEAIRRRNTYDTIDATIYDNLPALSAADDGRPVSPQYTSLSRYQHGSSSSNMDGGRRADAGQRQGQSATSRHVAQSSSMFATYDNLPSAHITSHSSKSSDHTDGRKSSVFSRIIPPVPWSQSRRGQYTIDETDAVSGSEEDDQDVPLAMAANQLALESLREEQRVDVAPVRNPPPSYRSPYLIGIEDAPTTPETSAAQRGRALTRSALSNATSEIDELLEEINELEELCP